MKLNGRDWGFIAVAGLVVVFLGALSLVGKKAVPMSAGPYHAGATAATPRADCMVCHDPSNAASTAPLPASHPLVWKKETVSCTTCHAPPSQQQSSVAATFAAPSPPPSRRPEPTTRDRSGVQICH